MKSCAASLASLGKNELGSFLDGLSNNALVAMPWLWELWLNPLHQAEPGGNWDTWVIMGGRGAGKTRAGAEWVRAQAEGSTPTDAGRYRRIALVGETIEQVRAVMVEGESGLLACTPPDRRPKLIATQRKLIWPNGAEAFLVSAANYEALRGPQFDCAWSDELAKWKQCRDAWDMLQFTLRLGDNPRQIVTTTPRDNPVLVEVLARTGTVVSRAGTDANVANLAPGFLEKLQAQYKGTWLGRQELDGELVQERDGALWSRALIERSRQAAVPPLDRVVVAVDPPVSTGERADECGIVVVGLAKDELGEAYHAWVLQDLSCKGLSPMAWAKIAAEVYEYHMADRLVAEVNQGGDLVESLIRQIAPNVSYRGVHAKKGKRLRAEPIAALYEQGRVHHVGVFKELEDQMCSFAAGNGGGSPDRLDALVWAITDLIIDAPVGSLPKVRTL